MGTLATEQYLTKSKRENIGIDVFGFFYSEDLNGFEVLTSNSPHEINTYLGLKLKTSLSLFQLASLMKSEKVLPYVTENKLSWHVVRNVSFIVDSDSLKNRQDIGTDAWRWEAYKILTISSSDISEEATYHVADVISEFRTVKIYYRCNQETSFKGQIIAVYSRYKQCKSRQSPFKNCSGNILITYCFSGEERNIKPCKNVRVYGSTKDKI